MKPITKDLLHDASLRLMFTMTESQYDVLISEFDILLRQMALLGKIDHLDQLTPMTFPFPIKAHPLRQDIPQGTLTQVEATQNASFHRDGQIKLPKVVG